MIQVSYLAKQVVVLYQQHQVEDRLDAYLGKLEEVITCTDWVVGLGELFSIVQRAVRGSLSEESESYTNQAEFIVYNIYDFNY